MIKLSFENITYGSCPKNEDLNNLSIEYKKSLFTERPIDNLTDNSLEMLKVNFIERLLDNIIYESNPRNYYLNELPFDGDKS